METNSTRLWLTELRQSPEGKASIATVLAMAISGALAFTSLPHAVAAIPLIVMSLVIGVPLVIEVAKQVLQGNFGADFLGLTGLLASLAMGEYWVAAIIALMLSGGEALEEAATARASAALDALAKRSPQTAHRRAADGSMTDIAVADVVVGDVLVVFPHEICPVDGEVVEGHGAMDESFLTGEPYVIPKTPGSAVLSGALNSTSALVIRAEHTAGDSRYAKIVGILVEAEEKRPPIRRLADRLGGVYTAIAFGLGFLGWAISGDPDRFLAVIVIATPCPLLIGVPVAIIGAISLAAKQGIIIKDPSMLERLDTAKTMIFDKTGTLTYGEPALNNIITAPGIDKDELLQAVASLEQFSRHPLSFAILKAGEHLPKLSVDRMDEHPGKGLVGVVEGTSYLITGRRALEGEHSKVVSQLPAEASGLECVVLRNGEYAGTLQFRDEPRHGAREFITHLLGRHGVTKTMLISGDRDSEVRYLAEKVGISEAYSSVAPEEKLEMVRRETAKATTVFLGDGINDAPAMTAASVGIAFGSQNDITGEAAHAVVLDSSMERLDELLHISRRMRRIALQSAVGGIVLSGIGMALAVFGYLPPLAGAIGQEIIDLAAILNASRVALVKKPLADFHEARV